MSVKCSDFKQRWSILHSIVIPKSVHAHINSPATPKDMSTADGNDT